MASNDDTNNSNDEKPNLRPTKRVTAGGKSVYLHHAPVASSNKAYIHASWAESRPQTTDNSADPFGIEEPHVQYSLNKKQRWEVLTDFRERIANQSSSSSENELGTQSDSEQQKKSKLRRRKGRSNTHQTKYRLYELHDIPQGSFKFTSVTSNIGEQRVQLPKKTYMERPVYSAREDNNDDNRRTTNPDVTYYAVMPPPREKQLTAIRRQHGQKAKKAAASFQRSKFSQVKEGMDADVSSDEDQKQTSSDENNEPITPTYLPPQRSDRFRLNDFIPVARIDENTRTLSITENLVTLERIDPKALRIYPDDAHVPTKFHRQMSREEKLYNRDKAVFQQQQKGHVPPVEKSQHHLMSLSFRSVLINRADLDLQYLSKTFGKNFLHAQCYPKKYLIALTDRLKSSRWLSKSDLFPTYSSLNCYLILVPQDESTENFSRIQVGLNMDLFSDTVEIENLYESTESIYSITDLIERTIEFITTLPLDVFKPLDHELSRRKVFQNEEDHELSESEFLNKQLRHIQLTHRRSKQNQTILEEEELNSEVSTDEYTFIRPDICTSCYGDIDESIPMTALKACAHWFCNDCWRKYLQQSIQEVKVVLCPEWNCCSIVDAGTILSLVNVRCMSVYERNIEKCLVNVSRSYVKCPAKSCTNIAQVIGSGIDHVRCRCGHQFCLSCKQEPHFPATCRAYRIYMDEVYRNGDLISDYNAVTQVKGRNCISCNNFIEKNGGCNHMTCRCGAEFCWSCTGYWQDHNAADGTFRCPKEAVPLQEQVLAKQHNQARRYYYTAIRHRHERVLAIQYKQNENAKRLLGTIPLDKSTRFDTTLIQSQIDKRESVFQHLLQMVKYISYLHRLCEFVAVSADGYGNSPSEFRNSIQPFETIVFNMSQILEGGRGYKAIEQLKQLHTTSEKLIERLRRAVTLRELRRINTTGYVTS